jgi:hypothetical protein
MAHAVINGAPMDGAAGEETLPELAQYLILGLEETIARLQGRVRRIEPLEALAARDQGTANVRGPGRVSFARISHTLSK